MPASELTWNTGSAPVFQVYGTKRKAECEPPWQPTPQEDEKETAAKRLCAWTSEQSSASKNMAMAQVNTHQTNFSCQQTGTFEAMQSESSFSDQNKHVMANCAPWSNEEGRIAVQQPPPDQGVFSMDLLEGTYSASQLPPDLTADHTAMDSDCVPDPEQYQHTPNNRPQASLSTAQDIRSGDCSPTSGRVRCYCKPSWEGMMDVKPWISDYY